MVEYDELGNSIVGESLAQLLRDPGAGRMTRDIAVQDAATIVADDEEAGSKVRLLPRNPRSSKTRIFIRFRGP